ncbi:MULTISPECIES: histidine--tRNA ligase [unclassified Limnobacter]|jgi:histidyl-tRNA synthetase|uniref:histidine--tRNA ligase n=1 Tax=unclassified Limnobacter TaxID=2630203 RepID=UPI000156C93E|nr:MULTISPECIES: histidine--tRNA ligase [unclassified Limnobacter]EDM83936.1 histidyl-tRNA synthetase [Limnobacter sp. MED105]MAZ08773.1 histidine--tRNA ligase [Sutterellaceae bacterium]|tara:strand:+ start:27614 stop:28939 length:1326 start_codon:yes stop_codon:yes gene_type:complete
MSHPESPEQSKAKKQTRLQSVKGMNDVLPVEGIHWENLEVMLREWLTSYGYRLIKTPVLEPTSLFRRGIGEVTDIVEKEMFSFVDRLNGDELTLRPEFTAGIARATIQHNLTYAAPQRVYSMGPVFRHERPQRGRYRQFHQLDVEALGFAGPDIDAELIVMLSRLWREMGLEDVRLEINCLGEAPERLAHRQALITYFEANAELLDEDAKRRLHSNPLRILDTKNPTMQDMVNGAPRLSEFLGEQSLAHYQGVKRLLDDAGVRYIENPRLVRGLDYYNLTVFEWITDALGTQGTICGGGRYDGLIEVLGGKPTPAIGFAIGLERLLELYLEVNQPDDTADLDVYVVHQGEGTARRAFTLAEELRDAGFAVVLHAGGGGFKSQMKRADVSGAAVAVILGENELNAGTAAVKLLRGESKQEEFKQEGLAEAIFGLLYGEGEES